MSNHKHWHGDVKDEDDDVESDEEDEDEYVEQVCDVVCPHCHQPMQIVVAPTEEEDDLDDEEDEDLDDEDA